jgi:hypothetical protein
LGAPAAGLASVLAGWPSPATIVTAGAGAAAAVLAATDPETDEDEEAVAPELPPSATTVTAGAGGDPAAGEDAALPIGETWGLEVGFAPGG